MWAGAAALVSFVLSDQVMCLPSALLPRAERGQQ